MSDVVIVEAVRSPVGRRGGVLAGVHPADLAADVLQELVARAGVDPGVVDDVVWGCVSQGGEQSGNVARTAVLTAGRPAAVAATTVDRQCGSSQQAVHFAAGGLASGEYEVVVAGGVESMTRVPMGSTAQGADRFPRRWKERFAGHRPNQGLSAEMIAARWGLDRTRLDEFGLESPARAAAAQDSGAFDRQIVPVTDPSGSTVTADEGVRRGGTLEKLGRLRPAFAEDGVVTAATSSQVSDGAAALLLTTAAHAGRVGVRPIARVHTTTVVGDDPVMMLTGPIPATRKLLMRSGIGLDEIGVFEVNEAFAPIPLAWMAEFGVDPKKVNPLGGAIALGHPLGGSGARIMTTMLHHMRDNGIRYGLQTMCEGGGLASTTLLELL